MLAALLFACASSPTDSAGAAGTDTAEPADTGDTADTATAPTLCEQLGLPVRAWDPSGTDGEFDVVAPDATLTQLDGSTWTLSTAWTGCESVVFVVLRNSSDYPDLSHKLPVRDWMEGAAPNVHWVFFSEERTEDDRIASLTALQANIEGVADADEATLAQWQSHTHFVSTAWNNTGTWIDDLVAAYGRGDLPLNFAIDRFQRIRELGYLSDPVTGWKQTEPTFLNYEVTAYNAQAALQDRLDAEAATVLHPFVDTTERVAIVDFGSAATVAGYDTMELDLSFICNGHPDATGCGEWDYLAYVYLCDADDPATADVDESTTCTEIGRFITAYARPGRWVVDATPFLAMVQEGGEKVIRVDSANAPLITLDVRLSDQGKGVRPVALQYLWAGGSFNADYNTGREAIAFTPPEGTTRVDVMGLITGHGYGQDTENCAEFCNHQHQFTVNGTQSWMEEFTMAGTNYGCADQVESGTVPNQYGTWVLGRGGWCPGRQVDPWSADVTGAVNLTGANTITYAGLFNGEPYVPVPYDSGQGFGAIIVANTWLVYYR
jgi:hypothetical protein